MANDPEANRQAQRQTAAYARSIAWSRHTTPNMSDEEMDRIALAAVDAGVYGADAKKDRNGNWIEQGLGSKGHENENHFRAILKYEGREAYNAAVAEIWRRDANHAKKLGLPQPART